MVGWFNAGMARRVSNTNLLVGVVPFRSVVASGMGVALSRGEAKQGIPGVGRDAWAPREKARGRTRAGRPREREKKGRRERRGKSRPR